MVGRGVTRIVWKFLLSPGRTSVLVGFDAEIVAVGPFRPGLRGPAVWVEMESAPPDAQELILWVFGTGAPIPEGLTHVGSAWCEEYMWHVYRSVPA